MKIWMLVAMCSVVLVFLPFTGSTHEQGLDSRHSIDEWNSKHYARERFLRESEKASEDEKVPSEVKAKAPSNVADAKKTDEQVKKAKKAKLYKKKKHPFYIKIWAHVNNLFKFSCQKEEDECFMPVHKCCDGFYCHPEDVKWKAMKGKCSKCKKYNEVCNSNHMCCSEKCLDLGAGHGQCGPSSEAEKVQEEKNKKIAEKLKKKSMPKTPAITDANVTSKAEGKEGGGKLAVKAGVSAGAGRSVAGKASTKKEPAAEKKKTIGGLLGKKKKKKKKKRRWLAKKKKGAKKKSKQPRAKKGSTKKTQNGSKRKSVKKTKKGSNKKNARKKTKKKPSKKSKRKSAKKGQKKSRKHPGKQKRPKGGERKAKIALCQKIKKKRKKRLRLTPNERKHHWFWCRRVAWLR